MADKTAILSVGIDVGTSTTQVVFSKLQMDNAGGYFSVPRVAIVDKEVVYKSEVYMTPLKTDVLIDTDALRNIVAAEFRKAGYRPEDTDSGAVIITGESARKENSDAVLKSLSDFAGDFVVSAAGPDMESLIAGKGSGAWQYSMDHHCRVANLDIGGGTTNVVLFEDGETLARGCLDIGGRLICMNPQGIITKVSPAAAVMAQAAGVSVSVGDRCDELKLTAVTRQMAAALNAYLGVGTKDIDAILRQIKTPGSSDFPVPEKVQAVFFSGGVADLIRQTPPDAFAYGDIGVLLGRAIRRSALCQGDYVLGEETIRATVIGAGCHSTQLSGSTVFARDVRFPLQNLPVLALTDQEQNLPTRRLVERIAQLRARWEEDSPAALFLPGLPSPGYDDLANLAGRLAEILPQLGSPAVVVTGEDMAKALGQALATRLPGPLLCLDGLELPDGSFLDVAAPVAGGAAYPVVKKTLVLA